MAAKNSLPDISTGSEDAVTRPAPLGRLRKRADFVAATRGRRRVTPNVTLETAPGPDAGAIRAGFTATKKLGNAVARNRAKRRLRAAAAQVLPLSGRVGSDYVLVARAGTLTAPFTGLVRDLSEAVRKIHQDGQRSVSSP